MYDEDPGELSLREVHIYNIYNYTHLNGQNARPNIDYLKDIFYIWLNASQRS